MKMPLWVRRQDGEAKVDRFAMREFGPNHVRLGAYHPLNDWQSDLRARPLWVKTEDCLVFHSIIMLERYPEEFATPADLVAAETASAVPAGDPSPKPLRVPVSDAYLRDWWKRLGLSP